MKLQETTKSIIKEENVKMEQSLVLKDEFDVNHIQIQVQKIQQIMNSVMKKDEHYGIIPGTQKPTLLKPGAEKLGLTFRLAPVFSGENVPLEMENGHREFIIKCDLIHIPTGKSFGQGVGSCSSKESKYRYRWDKTENQVPKEYWSIRDQDLLGGPQFVARKSDNVWWIYQRVEHDNPADYYNTILKMAKKRAHVDAMLTATAASDIFTQDLEDMDIKSEPKKKEDKTKDKLISEAQAKRLYAIGMQRSVSQEDAKKIIAKYGYASSKEILTKDYEKIVEEIEKFSSD